MDKQNKLYQEKLRLSFRSYFNITNLSDSSVQAELDDNIKIILYILTILAQSSVEVGIVVAGVTIIKRRQMHVNYNFFHLCICEKRHI